MSKRDIKLIFNDIIEASNRISTYIGQYSKEDLVDRKRRKRVDLSSVCTSKPGVCADQSKIALSFARISIFLPI